MGCVSCEFFAHDRWAVGLSPLSFRHAQHYADSILTCSERPTKIGKKYQVDATTGEASYKKVKSSNLANSIQLGIRTMVAVSQRPSNTIFELIF